MHAQPPAALLERRERRVAADGPAVSGVGAGRGAFDARLVHAVEEPRLAIGRIGAAHAVEHDERSRRLEVRELAGEPLELRRLVGPRRVGAGVVVVAGRRLHRREGAPVPQVARPLPVLEAADGVPEARRVHALAAVVRRVPPVLAPEEALAGLEDEHRVVGDRAAVVVEVVRALGVGVVGAAVDREVALAVDREAPGVEVVVLREVGAAGELDPGRVRRPPVADHEVADAGEEPMARQLGGARRGRVARHDLRVVPQELEHRNAPARREPAALPEEEGRVRVLEAVHRVAEDDAVDLVEVRELVVVVAGARAVGQQLVEVRRPHAGEDAVAARGVVARARAPHLREEGERRPRDPHVVRRLVVAAPRVHELRRVEDVVERAVDGGAHRRGPLLDRRVPFDGPEAEGREGEVAHRVVVVRGLLRRRHGLPREHLRGAVDELLRDAVLRRRVEAGVRVQPVEREGLPQEDEVAVRALDPAQARLRQLRERLLRERLVAREQVREGPARQVFGRPRALRVPRAQGVEAREGIVRGDEEARVRARRGGRSRRVGAVGRARAERHERGGGDERTPGGASHRFAFRAATIASASSRRAAS